MGYYSEIKSKLDDCCFIPVGYRCFTGLKMKAYNLKVESLPFDSGFFSTTKYRKCFEKWKYEFIAG